ncbi:MAG: Gx transporter family protein [Bacilli bacterium]|nr:Gx transporter family protein [Bacillales bacterium]MDY2575704.1 Gx transporter family protein [Bacilli bacterium]
MKKSSINTSKRIKKLTQLSLFLAIGIILNIVESMIPIPLPIPGIKLGLANTIGLIVLYYYSPKEYLYIGFLRVLVVGLLRSGLFSVSFLLSLSGWFLSSLVTLVLYKTKLFSIYGLSCTSAVFHGIGQIIVVLIIYNSFGLVIYLPVMMITGVITGYLTSFASSLVLSKLDSHISFVAK